MTSATKCRHCKTRNRPGTPMYYVGGGDPKLVRSAYYCPYCYDLFETAALAETPDLFQTDEVNPDAAATQLDALLNLTKRRDRRKGHATGRAPSMVMMFPAVLIVERLPFKRYYMAGNELACHTEKARQKMCVGGEGGG